MLSDRAAVAQQTLSWKVPYIRGCITTEWQKGDRSDKAEAKRVDQWEEQR